MVAVILSALVPVPSESNAIGGAGEGGNAVR
jgi:hypothetical protein